MIEINHARQAGMDGGYGAEEAQLVLVRAPVSVTGMEGEHGDIDQSSKLVASIDGPTGSSCPCLTAA